MNSPTPEDKRRILATACKLSIEQIQKKIDSLLSIITDKSADEKMRESCKIEATELAKIIQSRQTKGARREI
jgi:hypothetical protein